MKSTYLRESDVKVALCRTTVELDCIVATLFNATINWLQPGKECMVRHGAHLYFHLASLAKSPAIKQYGRERRSLIVYLCLATRIRENTRAVQRQMLQTFTT